MKPSLTFLAALLLAPPAVVSAADAPGQKPNILFLIADDLATRLGCYGDKAAITPHLDRLAREGVVFNRAYAQGSVCIPSRTSFMLGLNNRHAGATHFLTHPDTMTLGRWFRQHGYQTFSVGKIDHTDEYTDPQAWDIRVKHENVRPAAPLKRTTLDEDLGQKRPKVSFIGLADTPQALDDGVRTERAIRFLEQERDPQKPFFAAVGFHTPHVPWDTLKTMYDQHDPAQFTLEPTPPNATPVPPGTLLHEPGLELSDARQREAQHGYYAAVTLLDAQLGRLLDVLCATGLLENTVVVFTSDQGYHLGWRGQWCKHSLDEQVLRVPLIVRLPQGVRGARASGIVELLDLFPTFCDLAGLPAPATLDGKSFLPLLKNPQAEGKPGAFCSMPPGWGAGRTVRTKRWRLVERLDGSRELYDHGTDPAEYVNVINSPEHEPLIKRLHAMLEQECGPLPKAAANPKRSATPRKNQKKEP